jgi:glycosyltransferase involved in cell wall biosynthesis
VIVSVERPLVSVGLPVYNGERYLAKALDTTLTQDLEDLEVVVCDNASEDSTREITLDYVAHDQRVRYHRNERNLGLARNFNRVFELSRGKYFKWTAHDDWHPPQTLRTCVELLEREPSAVLCQSAVAIMDDEGVVFDHWRPSVDLCSPQPHIRLHRLIWSLGEPHGLYGVMRSSALRQTGLMRGFLGTDRVLLAELILQGPIWQLPDLLHYYRAPRLLPAADSRTAPRGPRPSVILDPANNGRLPLRTWWLAYEHLNLIARSRLNPQYKAWLMADVLARYGMRDSRRLAAEIYHSGRILVSRAT